jgi:hypothetical protein
LTDAEILEQAGPHSDMGLPGQTYLLESFFLAHSLTPHGLSVEFGTRKGGSALLQLLALEDMYRPAPPPFLFTVDPYGGKPYSGGGPETGPRRVLYGGAEFSHMKALLARFQNHVHFYMESLEFLKVIPMIGYWRDSGRREFAPVSFAFLDGDHDADTVGAEVAGLLPFMSRSGIILVDNFDKDLRMPKALDKYTPGIEFGPAARAGDLQLRIRMERL